MFPTVVQQLPPLTIAKQLWWKPPDAELDPDFTIHIYAQLLKSHRKEKIKDIDPLSLTPKYKSFVQYSLELLNHLHVDAYHWSDIYLKKSRDSNIFIQLFNRPQSDYYIQHFMTNAGKFDDPKFVRKLVKDSDFNVEIRYQFASLYCLHEEIDVITSIHPLNPTFELRMLQMARNVIGTDNLITGLLEFITAFMTAIIGDKENVALFYWTKLSRDHQKLLLSSFIYPVVKQLGHVFKTRTLQFYFDLLSDQEKYQLLREDFVRNWNKDSSILRTYLFPRSDPRGIIRLLEFFPDQVPDEVYSSILHHVAMEQYYYGFSVYRGVFERLWKMCPKEVVSVKRVLVKNMVRRNSF